MVGAPSLAKVLGLTKNNHKYKNVPEGLKWAIPVHEAATRPEVVASGKSLQETAKREVAEEKCKRRFNLYTP